MNLFIRLLGLLLCGLLSESVKTLGKLQRKLWFVKLLHHHVFPINSPSKDLSPEITTLKAVFFAMQQTTKKKGKKAHPRHIKCHTNSCYNVK